MRRLSIVEPADAIVFEDSLAGLMAARAAGMRASSSPAAPPTFRPVRCSRPPAARTIGPCRRISGTCWRTGASISRAGRSHECEGSGAAAPLSRAAFHRDLALLLRLLHRAQGLCGRQASAEGAFRPRRRPDRLAVDDLPHHLHARPVPRRLARHGAWKAGASSLWGMCVAAACNVVLGLARRLAGRERLPLDVRDDGHPRPRAGDGLAAQRRAVRKLDAPRRARNAVRHLGHAATSSARSSARRLAGFLLGWLGLAWSFYGSSVAAARVHAVLRAQGRERPQSVGLSLADDAEPDVARARTGRSRAPPTSARCRPASSPRSSRWA